MWAINAFFLFNTDECVYTSYDVAKIDYKHRKSRDKLWYCFLNLTFNDGNTFHIYDNSRYQDLDNTDHWQERTHAQTVNRQANDITTYSAVPLLLSYQEPIRNSRRIFSINPNLKALWACIYLNNGFGRKFQRIWGNFAANRKSVHPFPTKTKLKTRALM